MVVTEATEATAVTEGMEATEVMAVMEVTGVMEVGRIVFPRYFLLLMVYSGDGGGD